MRKPTIRQSRAGFERLLDGRPDRCDALAQLLSTARASGARADTAGLPAALAAFRSVSTPLQVDPRSTSMIKNVAAKIVAAKLLTIGGIALAVATGGVAAAASTGHLPGPLPHSNHASEVAVTAVTSAADPSSTPTASDSPSASDSESESAEPTSAHPSASPSPSLRGLCTSWLARPHLQGKADTNPAFNFLVTTAGGTDAVEAYCTELLASIAPERSGSPSASPGHESGKPSVVPSHSHPSGKPNPLPTPSHPAGR